MLIASEPDMEVVAEAGDGREAVNLCRDLTPDVAVVDITLPVMNGIQAIGQIRALSPTTRVLVLTGHEDPAFVRSVLAVGGAGYVVKRSAHVELLSAIRTVHRGGTFVDPSLGASLAGYEEPRGGGSGDRPNLSERERTVLVLLAQGHTNQEIADSLFLSVKTVETYRGRLGQKLGLKTRADLVRYALETGLLVASDRPTSGLRALTSAGSVGVPPTAPEADSGSSPIAANPSEVQTPNVRSSGRRRGTERGNATSMVRRSALENGIRVVTEELPGQRSVSIGILVDGGAADETSEEHGLAHLSEHLMFQGTGSRSAAEIARLMDSVAGQVGGFTSRDYTGYFATVLSDYAPHALDLLGDVLLNSAFPLDAVEREKASILSEIDGTKDAPGRRALELLKAKVWAGHPLALPVAGRPETVRGFTREDVIYFVHRNYLPDRIIVAAAGHVDHDDFLAQVRDAFWRCMGERPSRAPSPACFRSGIVAEAAPLSQAYFAIGLPAAAYGGDSRYAWHVVAQLLGGGISSRLFRRIREERGLVYDIGAEYHAYRDAGLLVVEGSASPANLPEVLALSLEELHRALGTDPDPVDEEELTRARIQIRGRHLIAGEDSSTRMSRLATQELYFGRQIPEAQVVAGIDGVDAAALRALAGPCEPALAVVGPEEALDRIAGRLRRSQCGEPPSTVERDLL